MAAGINDRFTNASNGTRPSPTTLNANLAAGSSPGTANCTALTGWATGTAVHFVIYKIDSNGKKVAGSQTDWKGIVSGATITNLTLKAGTNTGYSVGDVVEAAPTAAWADDMATGMQQQHNQDGSHSVVTATSVATTGNVAATGNVSAGGSASVGAGLSVTGKITGTDGTTIILPMGNLVLSGGIWSTVSGLNGAMTALKGWVNNKFTSTAAIASRAFTASKDTYIDQKDDGTIVYIETANNATTGMTITANSDGSPAMRIGYVATSGAAITAIKQVSILVPSASSFSGFDALGNRIYPQKGDTAVGRYIRPSAVTTGQPGATPATYNGCNNIPFQSVANTDYIMEFFEPVVSGITATGAWTLECYLSATPGAFTTRIDEMTMIMIGAANNGLYFQLPFNSAAYSGLTYFEFKLRSVSTTGTATMNGDTSTRMGRFSIYKR
jgi:hypothetical protein